MIHKTYALWCEANLLHKIEARDRGELIRKAKATGWWLGWSAFGREGICPECRRVK